MARTEKSASALIIQQLDRLSRLLFPRYAYIQPMNMRLIKAVLLLSSGMTVMAGSVISPALPEISRHFSGENPAVLTKLILTMPALTIAICAPLAGHISDLFGRRRLLFWFRCLYTAFRDSVVFLSMICCSFL